MQRSSIDGTGKLYELMLQEFTRLFLRDSELNHLSITKIRKIFFNVRIF